MNKNRLIRLEKSLGKQLQEERVAPTIWRPEGGRIAIQERPFILERLKSLNREVVATKEANFKDDVFQTAVRDNIALPEALVRGSYISI